MSEQERKPFELCPTEGSSDRIPTLVLLLGVLLVIAVVPLAMMFLRPLISQPDSSTGFIGLIGMLLYLALVAVYVIGAFYYGGMFARKVVDLHHGRYHRWEEITMVIIGALLTLGGVYSILNLYGLRLFAPVDALFEGMREGLRNTLLRNLYNEDDLRRTFLESALFRGLCGLTFARAAILIMKENCPRCGRYNHIHTELVSEEEISRERYMEEGRSTTETRLNGPLGGKGTGDTIDPLWHAMPEKYKERSLAWAEQDPLTGKIKGIEETRTEIHEVEEVTTERVWKHTCKYCGAFIRYTRTRPTDKRVLNTTVQTEQSDVTMRVYRN